jgi:hypothetical protein
MNKDSGKSSEKYAPCDKFTGRYEYSHRTPFGREISVFVITQRFFTEYSGLDQDAKKLYD